MIYLSFPEDIFLIVKHRVIWQEISNLKKAIKSDQFQNAIRLIDFHFETRRTRRIIKEILNFTMKTRLYLFTYMMIKLYVGKI